MAIDESTEKLLSYIKAHPDDSVVPPRIYFWDILYKAVSRSQSHIKIAHSTLDRYRSSLGAMFDNIAAGNVLRVNAPMGLGKTHSVVKMLAEKTDISAMIFVPTKELIREYLEKFEEMGVSDDVAVIKGVEEPCPNCVQIYARYNNNYFYKDDICSGCANRNGCEFLDYSYKLKRIVLTTHKQYLSKMLNNDLAKYRGTDGGEVDRNVFLVDEDIIMDNLLSTVTLNADQLRLVSTQLIQVLHIDSISEITRRLFSFIDSVTDTSARFFPALDREFSFSAEHHEAWKRYMREQAQEWNRFNHLTTFENIIKYGFVLEFNSEGVKEITTSNIKYVNLTGKPYHIFLDGTPVDDIVFRKIFQAGDISRIDIQNNIHIDNIKVFQVMSQNLPYRLLNSGESARSEITQKINKYIDLVCSRLQNDECYPYSYYGLNGPIDSEGNLLRNNPLFLEINENLFKALRKNHIFLVTKMKYEEMAVSALNRNGWNDGADYYTGNEKPLVAAHYGNTKGLNKASDCNVGIMLGPQILSVQDLVSMAIPFLENITEPVVVNDMKDYATADDDEAVFVFKEPYQIVNLIQRNKLIAEHMQAICRTRHLFHKVKWFVVSKENIAAYPFIRPENVIRDFEGEGCFDSDRELLYRATKAASEAAGDGVFTVTDTANILAGYETWGKSAETTQRAVRRYFTELEENRFLVLVHSGRPNKYRFIDRVNVADDHRLPSRFLTFGV